MALLYLIIALVIQGSFTLADIENCEEVVGNAQTVTNGSDIDDEVIKDFHDARKDWIDFLLLPGANFYPTSSFSMMSQATNSEKSVEEQLEDIKDIAQKITLAIKSEMESLMAYTMSSSEKEKEIEETDDHLRKKRSVETPMASSQLINRLLKHIKSNNEYQNIAIEKMMTAQEIAEKYGIEFCPDTEIICDLAMAANQHAQEITELLQDTLDMKNVTKNDQIKTIEAPRGACPVQHNQEQKHHVPVSHPAVNHHHHADSYPSYNYYYNSPYETQIPAPPSNYYSPPVSKRPNFYDTVSYDADYTPYCSMEPITTTTFVLPEEELIEPEPELVGEEFEETVTSKVYVDRGDEPGSATVNHVMTYTVAEKTHFKTPEIERLPQQMQYCFFLM